MSHLLRHVTSVYNGHLREPLTRAVTTCFYDLRLSLRIEHPTFRLRGQHSNSLRHRRVLIQTLWNLNHIWFNNNVTSNVINIGIFVIYIIYCCNFDTIFSIAISLHWISWSKGLLWRHGTTWRLLLINRRSINRRGEIKVNLSQMCTRSKFFNSALKWTTCCHR